MQEIRRAVSSQEDTDKDSDFAEERITMSEELKEDEQGVPCPTPIPPAPKTPEQLAAERLERYKQSPDSFIEMSDIVMACVKDIDDSAHDVKLFVYVGKEKRSILAQAKTELEYAVQKHFAIMEARAAAKQQPNIITPGDGNGKRKGILNFARGLR
jgi:hypothetical protein